MTSRKNFWHWGDLYGFRLLEDEDFTKYDEASRRGCALGDRESCHRVGMSLKRFGQTNERGASRKFFEKACEAEYAPSCSTLASIYERGDGVAQNSEKAKARYAKACDIGDGGACTDLASLYESAGEHELVLEYRTKACDKNVGWSCSWVSDVYERGEGVAIDHELALSFFQLGCAAGNKAGCK